MSDFSRFHGIRDVNRLDGPVFVEMALLLPSYQGATFVRIRKHVEEQGRGGEELVEPVPDGRPTGVPAGADLSDPVVSHRVAQQQPVASAEKLRQMLAPAPGVDVYGTVTQVPAGSPERTAASNRLGGPG